MRKTKKFAAILLLALILSSSFSVLPVSAATFVNDTAVVSSDESLISGDYEYSVLADGTVEITQYLGSDTNVIVPENIAGRTVSKITYAFSECSFIKNIVIPNGVTEIGSYTFRECTSLHSIKIPDSVKIIGYYTFENCVSLSEITLPKQLKEIGTAVFKNCSSLKKVVIPDTVTTIREGAFEECTNLSDIIIPDTVNVIESAAFWNTKWLNNKPDGLIIINDILYSYKGEMPQNTNINVPSNINYISSQAFSGYENLQSVNISDNVTEIGKYAFLNCSSLKSVKLSNSIRKISQGAFMGCSSLTNISIPNNVNTIEASAFLACTSLKSITIPASVTEIKRQPLGYDYLDAKIEDFKIYGYKNTAAETYAKENGFEFISLGEQILTGDANQDGTVNIKDVTYLQMHIAGNKNTDGSPLIDETNKQLFDSIDMNNDGKLTVNDVTALQTYLAQNN